MKIAVTGGAGFIGRRVVERLVEHGHDVLVLDLVEIPGQGGSSKVVDITRFDDLKGCFDGVEVVYHLAGPVVEAFRRSPYASHVLQDLGTLNVLETARAGGVRKIVLASSFYVYDGLPDGMIVNEETSLDLVKMELFGASKFMAEKLVKAFAAKYKLEFGILRFGSAYGWGDCTNVIKTFIEIGQGGRPIEVWGRGLRRNQYTFVEDIADGCVAALDKVNETFNLVSPEETSTGGLALLLKDLFGFDVVFNEVQPEGPSMAYMSSRKAMQALRWRPQALRDVLGTQMKLA